MQLVALAAGSCIGDMTVVADAGAVRSATVAAMTQVMALHITNARFRRIVPPDVLQRMRTVATKKDVLTKNALAEDHEVWCLVLVPID